MSSLSPQFPHYEEAEIGCSRAPCFNTIFLIAAFYNISSDWSSYPRNDRAPKASASREFPWKNLPLHFRVWVEKPFRDRVFLAVHNMQMRVAWNLASPAMGPSHRLDACFAIAQVNHLRIQFACLIRGDKGGALFADLKGMLKFFTDAL